MPGTESNRDVWQRLRVQREHATTQEGSLTHSGVPWVEAGMANFGPATNQFQWMLVCTDSFDDFNLSTKGRLLDSENLLPIKHCPCLSSWFLTTPYYSYGYNYRELSNLLTQNLAKGKSSILPLIYMISRCVGPIFWLGYEFTEHFLNKAFAPQKKFNC